MSQSNRATELPSWLWFFLALPLGLIAVLIWQRRRLSLWVQKTRPILQQPVKVLRRVRYVEPDSIPIDTRLPIEPEIAPEAGMGALKSAEIPIAVDPGAAGQPAPAAQTILPDDLRIIEGIGPKIAGLLTSQGITTFQALADTSVERLGEILTQAKLRQISDPGTWAEQARLAAAGSWEALERLQDQLKAGRRKPKE